MWKGMEEKEQEEQGKWRMKEIHKVNKDSIELSTIFFLSNEK